jgi:tetratricopeptide (TPR) repeat protein
MNYFGFLKSTLKPVAGILSFLALLVSVGQGLSTPTRVGPILLVLGTIGLVLFNVWIHSLKHLAFRKSFLVTVHSVSTLLLVLGWTVLILPMLPRQYAFFLYRLGKYEAAAAQLERFHSTHEGDTSSYLTLADSYGKVGDNFDEVSTLETVLNRDDLSRSLSPVKKGRIYWKIGGDLLTDEYQVRYVKIRGTPRPDLYQSTVKYLTLASTYESDNPVCDMFLGYAIAANTRSGESVPEVQREVRARFNEARSLIDQRFAHSRGKLDLETQFHYWFGRALAVLGDKAGAKNELEQGLNALPSRPSAQRDRFLLSLARNELGDNRKVFQYLRKVTNKEKSGEAMLLLGTEKFSEAYKLQGQTGFENAARDAESTIAFAALLGAPEKEVHKLLGTLAFMSSDYEKAETEIRLWRDQTPADPLPYELLVRALSLENKFEEAKPYALKWTEIAPGDAEAHFYLGEILLAANDYKGAVAELQRAIDLQGEKPQVTYWLLGLGFLRSGQSSGVPDTEASSIFERALAALGKAADLAKAAGDPKLEQLINSDRATAWNALAFLYAEQRKNLDLARDYIEQALKVKPSDPYLVGTKGWVMMIQELKTHRHNQPQRELIFNHCQTLLESSLAHLPSDASGARAEVQYELGVLADARGIRQSARRYYLEALRLNPAYDPAKKALEESKSTGIGP